MSKKGVLGSFIKLLIVVVVSILIFAIGVPLISVIIQNGYGSIFTVTLFLILVLAVIIDQIRRFIK